MANNFDIMPELGEFKANLSQYKAFIQTNIWKDLEITLSAWLTNIRNDLENLSGDELLKHQGRAQAIRTMLQLPTVIIEGMEEDQQRLDVGEDEEDGRD